MKKTILITLMLLTSVMTFAQIPTNGLVAEYTFSGNAKDGTINGNAGIVNDAKLTTDRFGNDSSAYYFDGIDDYITMGDVDFLDGKANATWNFWMSTIEVQPQPPTHLNGHDNPFVSIFRKEDSYIVMQYVGDGANYWRSFIYTTSTNWDLGFRNNQISDIIDYDGSWIMISVVKDNNLISVFKNGNLINTQITYGDSLIQNSTKKLMLGKDGTETNDGGAYNGKLDDIRIYDRALDQNEITQLYNEGNVTTGVSNNTITNNNTIVNYQVYDLSGKLIYNNSIKPLNVGFTKGIYILKSFKLDSSIVSSKFIVQ